MDFLKDIKIIGNEYAALVSEGVDMVTLIRLSTLGLIFSMPC